MRVKIWIPKYMPALGCYVVDFITKNGKGFKTFDSYKEGVEWIKSAYPEYYAKHFKTI